jgi:hypothetical protein
MGPLLAFPPGALGWILACVEDGERLEWAVYDDDVATVRGLLAVGADAKAVDEDGYPLIELAVSRGSAGALCALVECGGSLDGATYGRPPLLHGVVFGSTFRRCCPYCWSWGRTCAR